MDQNRFFKFAIEKRNHNKHIFVGWQTSRGDKGQIFVDKKGEFLWTFLGEFLWTFLVNFCGHFFNSNDKSYTIIKQ